MKWYLVLTVFIFSCTKSNQKTNEKILGTWAELNVNNLGVPNKEIDWNGHTTHYHINNNNTVIAFSPISSNSYSDRHPNSENFNYTINGDMIYFTYPPNLSTGDSGRIVFIDDNNFKIVGIADLSDPTHIPTVYWRRTDD